MRPTPPPAPHAALAAPLADPRRGAAVRASGLLDAPAEAALDRLARLAAKLLGTPLATVTLVDADRQFYAACVGVPEPLATARQTPLEMSFCRFAVAARAPLVIRDTRLDPRTRDMESVTALGVHAYAGVPLVLNGEAIGTLCVMDTGSRLWSDAQLDILADLAASVMTEIELRMLARASAAQAASLQQLSNRIAATTAELHVANARLTDATAAADAERAWLEAVLHALPAGVMVADAGGAVTHVNPEAAALCGGMPHATARAHSAQRGAWAATGRPVDDAEWPLARALRDSARTADAMIDLARPDGTTRSVLTAAAPVRAADGRLAGGVVVLVDAAGARDAAAAAPPPAPLP